jgi:phosphoenolpyruvate carboxylase
MALTASWQTTDSSPVRPTVDDEREHVGFYLVQVLYRVIPVLYESLQQALRDTYGEELPLPRLLRFGTWVGGDMDGNPNVDAHTIRNTLDAQRQAVLGRYQKELLQLASLLSQSTERVGVSDALQARVAHYQQLLPQVQSRPRHADMPYRLLNDRMRARLQATLDDGEGAYAGPDELIDDLQLILDSLRANRGEHAGGFAVQRLLWRVKTFGFHLARLDVRQESSVHARALAAVLGGDAAWDGLDALGRARCWRRMPAVTRRCRRATTKATGGWTRCSPRWPMRVRAWWRCAGQLHHLDGTRPQRRAGGAGAGAPWRPGGRERISAAGYRAAVRDGGRPQARHRDPA